MVIVLGIRIWGRLATSTITIECKSRRCEARLSGILGFIELCTNDYLLLERSRYTS